MPPTEIPPDTLAAYLNTDYRFGQGAEVVTLRIDTRSEALQWLYTWTGHRCGVFITTHNPLGEWQSQEANDDAHARLAAELKQRGMDAIEGEGVGPDGAWPAEKSFFVFGVDLETARMLGGRYRQNAVVWAGEDAVPKLILLR